MNYAASRDLIHTNIICSNLTVTTMMSIMRNFDLNDELSSDSDGDDDHLLREDIEALSRACLPTTSSLNTSSPTVPLLSDDDDDDLELVRSIQQRYGHSVADDIKPLASLPPPLSDDDDDYEFYQAIKARFSHHHPHATDETKKNDVSCRGESVSNDVGGDSSGREFVEDHIDDAERERYDTTDKEDAFTSVSSFPFAAQTFIDAIKKNRACQNFIRDKLLHIEAKMGQIKELHKRLKTFRGFQVQCKKVVGQKLSQKQDDRIQLISVAKQRANAKGRESNGPAICYGPSENSYVVWYKAALQKFPLSFHRDKWSKEDIQNLEKGIVRQYQEKLLRRSEYGLSSDEEPGFNNGVDAMMLSIKNHKITPETIQCFSGEVNWTQLATIYLPRRSGEECEARWLNHENQNSDHWTKAEEVKLLSLIEKNGFHSWRVVAQNLGTNRTPYQCLAHYQRSLNASILKGAWTDDEDAHLSSAVELYGESNWQAVASMLEGRTGPQCSNSLPGTGLYITSSRASARFIFARPGLAIKKQGPDRPATQWVGIVPDQTSPAWASFSAMPWAAGTQAVLPIGPAHCTPLQIRVVLVDCKLWKKTLNPARQKVGRWDGDEDKRLKVAAILFRRSWHRIAQFVPGRTQVQCRERWVNNLNPSLNLCEWTEEEDMKLKEAIAQHGYCWAKVATCIPMRTDNHCLRRWKSLYPHEFPLIQAARSMQKVALISNFVDREEERPTLGPKDFVSLPIEDSTDKNGNGKQNPKRRRMQQDILNSNPGTFVDGYETSLHKFYFNMVLEPFALRDPQQQKASSGPKIFSSPSHPITVDRPFITVHSNKKNAKRKHKKSKVETEQLKEEWEDLPLSVLFDKAFSRKR
ncbi:hypothetical protein KSS87_017192 [Heliosperma pusillum]|nr:hypothetical protein KSS87_017192 [Heliosperma pusillum]